MRPLLQQLHIYAGLQTSVGLLVFGVTAIAASLDARPVAGPAAEVVTTRTLQDVQGEAGAVARQLKGQLGYPVSEGPWAVSERDGIVRFLLESPNAQRHVAYRRSDGQVTVRTQPSGFGRFAVRMHETEPMLRFDADLPIILWSWFNFLCGASLLFLVASGLYLFVTTKRKPWYAWACLGVSSATLAGILLGLG